MAGLQPLVTFGLPALALAIGWLMLWATRRSAERIDARQTERRQAQGG